MSTLLWLIPCLPLVGFLINGLLRPAKAVAAVVGCAGPIAAFGLSLAVFTEVHHGHDVARRVFDWITVGDWTVSFGLRVDPLSAVMILVVTGVGSLIHLYSIAYMHEDEGFAKFFAYLNLFMFSMLTLVLGDSLLLMFVGWEGVGLCSYLLIGFWYKDLKNADAGKKAFITNRIGDFGFLLGMFCVWQLYGTLEFSKMAGQAVPPPLEATAVAAGFLLFLGATGKSAQIPLYVWLPDAMAGPTPVSALIHAATMVTAGVYMMARMNFLYVAVPQVLSVVVLVAAATALMAGLIAVAQNDIKKVLAYSTVSQLGFMFAGVAASDFGAGLFHVVTHAFFKALLFLGAGAVIHALHGEQDIRRMGGLGRKLPALAAVFTAGGLALAGFPFTSGFFSKDLILQAVWIKSQTSSPVYMMVWPILLATAGITAFYTVRLILVVFFNPPAEEAPGHGHEAGHADLHKPGMLMMGPLALLALLSLGAGFLEHPFEHFLAPVWKGGHAVSAEDAAKARSVNVGASTAVFVLGAGLAAFLYGRAAGRAGVKRFAEGGGRAIHRLLSNKFYVDEIYEYVVIAPLKTGATILWFVVDRVIIDTLCVNGAGRLVYAAGWIFRKPVTGSLNAAVATFVLGAIVVLAYVAYRFKDTWKLLPF